MPTRMELGQVVLTEGPLKDRFDWNDAYIRHLDLDRLLYWYRHFGGVGNAEGVQPYPDWESGPLWYGITMGHYLSACAMMYQSTEDPWYLGRVEESVDALAECQKPNGLLFAMEEDRFDRIEAGQDINQAGPAFYYIHKTLAGLIDAYECCGSQKALDVAQKLADWVYEKTQSYLEHGTRLTVLSVEYGGIAEPLYELYAITGSQKALEAAHFFQEDGIKRYWVNEFDHLKGLHANTTIPKAIGFVRAYMAGEGEDYLKAAEFFWELVMEKYMYPNGGVSAGEVFNALYEGAVRPNGNPSETCTIYNMIKLSQYLYELTDEVKYLDYIERALLNGIMGSIEESGCKTYYQAMHPDAKRVFNPYDGGFWCCVGTGMENFPLAGGLICYEREKGLDLNLLVSCEVETRGGVRLRIRSEDEKTTITVLTGGELTLRLRIPRWCSSCLLTLNGTTVGTKDGEYLTVARTYQSGDTLIYDTPFQTVLEPSDAEDVFTLRYGPYQMVGIQPDCSELIGTPDSGWMAQPQIYPEGEMYCLQLDGGQTLPLQKYGLITHQTFTTYFKRADGQPTA